MTRDRLLPPILAGLVLWGVSALRIVVNAALHGGLVWGSLLLLLPPLIYWLGLVPAILWLGARLPLRRDSLVRSIAAHVALASLAAALYAQLMIWILSSLAALWWPGFGPITDWGIRFQFGLLAYGFILSWSYVHEYFTEMRTQAVARAGLEAELAQAQLRALKAQLQPHFLFNTLHAITVLIRHDTESASRMVMRLSDLLRMTLLDADQKEVPLERELRFLRLYLEIEQTRFRDRLEVVWDIAPGLGEAAVPPLVLQPLVENALKHGVATRAGGGRVTIAAERLDGALMLQVTDNGPGLHSHGESQNGGGIGLGSTRRRLEKLYGSAHHLALRDNEDGGVTVSLGMPYRALRSETPGYA